MPVREGVETLTKGVHRLGASKEFVQGLEFLDGERNGDLPGVGGGRHLPGILSAVFKLVEDLDYGPEKCFELLPVNEKREVPKFDLDTPAALAPKDPSVPGVVEVGIVKAGLQCGWTMHGREGPKIQRIEIVPRSGRRSSWAPGGKRGLLLGRDRGGSIHPGLRRGLEPIDAHLDLLAHPGHELGARKHALTAGHHAARVQPVLGGGLEGYPDRVSPAAFGAP